MFVFGSGDCGQLGLGPDIFEKERPYPLQYFDDKIIVAVFAGGLHNIAMSMDGKLYSWGCNDQLALGRVGEETIPLPISSLKNEVIVDVACGDSISLALTQEGRYVFYHQIIIRIRLNWIGYMHGAPLEIQQGSSATEKKFMHNRLLFGSAN